MFKRFAVTFVLLISACQPVKKAEPVAINSYPVQYMATVNSSMDGCGIALCAQGDESFCAFPRGIPSEELTEGSIFWVQGNISVKEEAPGTVNACMGMVKNVIEVQTYIRHSSW